MNPENYTVSSTISYLSLGVDNVQLHGNALLSLLRNQCGQQEDNTLPCGRQLPPPRIREPPRWIVNLLGIYGVGIIVSVWYCKRPKLLYTAVVRCFEKRSNNNTNDKTQELLEENGDNAPTLAGKLAVSE